MPEIIKKKCKLKRCSRVFFYNYKFRREFCCPEHRYEYHFPKKAYPGEIACIGCGESFKPKRPNQIYCKPRCGTNYRMRTKYYPAKVHGSTLPKVKLENQTKCAIEDKLADLGLTAADVRKMAAAV